MAAEHVECALCGAAIANKAEHTKWHDALATALINLGRKINGLPVEPSAEP